MFFFKIGIDLSVVVPDLRVGPTKKIWTVGLEVCQNTPPFETMPINLASVACLDSKHYIWTEGQQEIIPFTEDVCWRVRTFTRCFLWHDLIAYCVWVKKAHFRGISYIV